jgi:hypothetical protein
MALLVPNEGESTMLNVMLGKSSSENLTLKLFTNNVTPGETDTSATYTEASGNGYAAITLTAANWTVTQGSGSPGATHADYTQQTFTFTGGPVSVYGYYIVGVTSTKVYWAEAFAAVANIPAGGGTIKITPTINLD